MSVSTYEVLQCGMVVARFARKADALAEAARLNADADEDAGEEVMGDGAASVYEVMTGADPYFPSDAEAHRGECDGCGLAIEERAARDGMSLPFCACGRRLGECDGSRKGCRPLTGVRRTP